MSDTPADAIAPPRRYPWLFLDLDGFFAACEQQANPALRGRPVGVVAMLADSTCILASSYPAKRLGITTGTPVGEARKRCPDLHLVVSQPRRYVAYHEAILEAVDSCIPIDRVLSIDEMACHLTGPQQTPAEAAALAARIKDAIRTRVGEALTCSIGIASNVFLAKVASNMRKPDGLAFLHATDLPAALAGLKLRDLPGIGPRMEARLARYGIHDIPTLYAQDTLRMRQLWGGIGGVRFHALLHGHDLHRQHATTESGLSAAQFPARATARTGVHAAVQTPDTQSLGHQHVLAPDIRTAAGGYTVLQRLLVKAAERLRRNGYYCRSLSVHVRLARRRGETSRIWEASRRFQETQETGQLLHELEQAWRTYPGSAPLRVGVVLGGLVPAELHQPGLFDTARDGRVCAVVDALNARFGRNTVTFGFAGAALSASTRQTVETDKIAFRRVPTAYETGTKARP